MTEHHPSAASSAGGSVLSWIKRHRTRLLLWLRLIIALGLMAVVISLVAADREKLQDVNWTLVPLAWLLMLISTLVKSLRWSLLVRRSGMEISFRRLAGSYLVGAFFSTVLPTSVGGDAVRAVDTAAKTHRVADATSSVLLERAIGLITVVGAGSIFALFMEPGKVTPVFVLMVHGLSITGIVGLVFLRQGWFMDPIAVVLTRLRLKGIVGKVHNLQNAFSEHLDNIWILLVMFILSIIANALTMGATYLVLTAVTNLHVPLAAFVPMVALATCAELIPISPSSIGVKESAYVFFLGLINVPATEAGVIAIILRVLMWALAMVGGVVFVLRTLGQPSEDQLPPPDAPSGRRKAYPPQETASVDEVPAPELAEIEMGN